MLPGLIAVEPMRELGKLLLVCGIALVLSADFSFSADACPFASDAFPAISPTKGKIATSIFRVVTCIVLSVALTLILWVMNLFRR